MNNWKWRDYQNDCFETVIHKYQKGINTQLLVQATGLGKRSQAVFMAGKARNSLFLAHTEELIDQAYHDFVRWYGSENVGMVRGNKLEIDRRFVVSSPLTIVNRLNKIPYDHFDMLQLDECFIAGTKIGNIKIENVKVGDWVDSYNHNSNMVEKRKVLSLFKNEIKGNLYQLIFSNGESFICTENHPIFIKDNGYIVVSRLLYLYNKINHEKQLSGKIFKLYCLWKTSFTTMGKQTIQVLFKRLFFEKDSRNSPTSKIKSFPYSMQRMRKDGFRKRSEKQEGIQTVSFNGLYLLLSRLSKIKLFQNSKNNDGQNQSKICFEKNEGKQSNEQSGNNRKNETIQQGKNVFSSRRKWSDNETTTDSSRTNGISDRICDSNNQSYFFGKIIAKLLQGRFSLFGSKAGNRGRRKNSLNKKMEVFRQTKNGNIEFLRLESITLYKQGNRSESTKSSEENYVYNFEVEGNNNYFANSVLVHNCHHYMAKSYYKAATYFQTKIRLGWTATPRRLDGLSLLDLFQEKTFEYGILKGIQEGYLTELKGMRIRTNVDLSRARKTMGDFNTSDLEALVDIPERNKLIVDSYEKYALKRQFICFAVDTNHIVNITKAFAERGHNVAAISSDVAVCPDREGTISAFKRGEILGLINCQVLTEGFDYSEVGAILDASPTLSESRYLQRVGRGTRLKSQSFVDKFGQNAIILDFVDISSRHKLVNSFELDKLLPTMDRVFVTKEDKEKIIREREARNIKVIRMTNEDEFINFTKPTPIEISKSEKMMEEATPAQIKLLQSLDLYTEKDEDGNEIEYTKLIVSQILQGEITPYMKRKMIEWKYNPTDASIAQYLAVSKIKRIERENAERDALRERNKQAMIERLKADGSITPQQQ